MEEVLNSNWDIHALKGWLVGSNRMAACSKRGTFSDTESILYLEWD